MDNGLVSQIYTIVLKELLPHRLFVRLAWTAAIIAAGLSSCDFCAGKGDIAAASASTKNIVVVR